MKETNIKYIIDKAGEGFDKTVIDADINNYWSTMN